MINMHYNIIHILMNNAEGQEFVVLNIPTIILQELATGNVKSAISYSRQRVRCSVITTYTQES